MFLIKSILWLKVFYRQQTDGGYGGGWGWGSLLALLCYLSTWHKVIRRRVITGWGVVGK